MSDTPKPSPNAIPHPPIKRDAPHSVVEGMGIVRKPLFSAPITRDGWQKMMLTHIAAAKQLGFTMFEIDTAEATVPRPKAKKQEPPIYSVWSSFSIQLEGDEWKVAAAEESPEETQGTVRTTVVMVYALAIE